ncbi:MAG: hypothetical protein AAFQ08_01535, partial [Bacteroidota bacterium]
ENYDPKAFDVAAENLKKYAKQEREYEISSGAFQKKGDPADKSENADYAKIIKTLIDEARKELEVFEKANNLHKEQGKEKAKAKAKK